MGAGRISSADNVRNHWWPRPGWRPGRIMYAWHLTFEDESELEQLVASYQDALRGQAGLDLVPRQWLHLTIQAVGYTDEISPVGISSVAKQVSELVGVLPPFTLRFHRAFVDREAIKLPPEPEAPLIELRKKIRDGIARATGTTADQVPIAVEQAAGFRPHVSLAYVAANGPAAPYIKCLSAVSVAPADVRIREVRLIEQLRVLDPEWVYRWVSRSAAPLRGIRRGQPRCGDRRA